MRKARLKKLFNSPVFSAADAASLGISSSLLAYYVNKGIIERVARGVYRNPQIENTAPMEWQDLLEIAQSIPSGTICVISALAYYGLTLDVQRQYWIALPNGKKAVKRPNTKFIIMRNTTLGRVPLKVGKYKAFIFDRERSVVDAFKFLSKESALYSLREYLKGSDKHKANLSKLAQYAKKLRTHILPYIEAMT